jgi:hypothetical protein
MRVAALALVLAELLDANAVEGMPVRELARMHVEAARDAGVEVPDLVALIRHESNGRRWALSDHGAYGLTQLLPQSPWGRAWAAEAAGYWALGLDVADELNVLWGARALRAGLDACDGSLVHAYGHYRTGRCVAGPKGERTARLAAWVRGRLDRG